MDRDKLIDQFLQNINLENYRREKLPVDASNRSYERIYCQDQTFILMNAPTDLENIKPFIKIDNLLIENNYNPPKIYHIDHENGFILLEDFGNNNFTKILSDNISLEDKLYKEAVDVIIKLTELDFPNDINQYDKALLLKELKVFTDWFLPTILDSEELNNAEQEFLEIWGDILSFESIFDKTLVLRDFHADNLMWLESGKVGLLDFQDAVIGSPIYDLISLLEDARRDVASDTVKSCKQHFIENMKVSDLEQFESEYSIFAAQRNCKIIGIFCRLSIRDKKPKYLDYLPRVWNHLEGDIKHICLKDINDWFNKYVFCKDYKASTNIDIKNYG